MVIFININSNYSPVKKSSGSGQALATRKQVGVKAAEAQRTRSSPLPCASGDMFSDQAFDWAFGIDLEFGKSGWWHSSQETLVERDKTWLLVEPCLHKITPVSFNPPGTLSPARQMASSPFLYSKIRPDSFLTSPASKWQSREGKKIIVTYIISIGIKLRPIIITCGGAGG